MFIKILSRFSTIMQNGLGMVPDVQHEQKPFSAPNFRHQ